MSRHRAFPGAGDAWEQVCKVRDRHADTRPAAPAPKDCRLDCLTLDELLEALTRLGFRPNSAVDGADASSATARGAPLAAGPADQQQLHAVKLLLRCATAALQRGNRGGGAPPRVSALQAWARACCLLRWDPVGPALDSDLRPSLAEALTGLQGLPAATDGDPARAGAVESLASMLLPAAPNPCAALDLLALLAGCPGGNAVAGALGDGLLRALVPAGLSLGVEAAAGRQVSSAPANIVLQQPWCVGWVHQG